MAVDVLFEDDALVVISKPSGMLSVPSPGATGTTVTQALASLGIRARPVHRLDRDVSGAMLLAKTDAVGARLEEAFRARAVTKTYWALVQGRLRPPGGTFNYPILDEGSHARVSPRGKPATTRFRVVHTYRTTTEVEIDLLTGRYNQIRLHFAHAGFPLVGERKYAFGRGAPLKFKRVALHSIGLEFTHPLTGAKMSFAAPLPADLAELRERAAL